jgi:hypothetical protein
MRSVLFVVLALALLSCACQKSQSKQNADRPCATRYLPVGDNPDIALDIKPECCVEHSMTRVPQQASEIPLVV